MLHHLEVLRVKDSRDSKWFSNRNIKTIINTRNSKAMVKVISSSTSNILNNSTNSSLSNIKDDTKDNRYVSFKASDKRLAKLTN
jgi:hypothetical protein